jgi:uncharacterized protein DUF4145
MYSQLVTVFEAGQRVRQGETIAPFFQGKAFHCVYCVVYAKQQWRNLDEAGSSAKSKIWVAECTNCHMETYWLKFSDEKSELIWPLGRSGAPAPHVDMPDDVRSDYTEAASILAQSPRGAGAILRLALQKLMPHLGEKGHNLNDDIASLVAKGLDPGVQKALDALRVIGNNAVHPLELDLQDDAQTVGALFGLINFIVDQRITHPKKLDELYAGLPEGARNAIAKRDGATPTA